MYKEMTTDGFLAVMDDHGDGHVVIHEAARRIRRMTETIDGLSEELDEAYRSLELAVDVGNKGEAGIL